MNYHRSRHLALNCPPMNNLKATPSSLQPVGQHSYSAKFHFNPSDAGWEPVFGRCFAGRAPGWYIACTNPPYVPAITALRGTPRVPMTLLLDAMGREVVRPMYQQPSFSMEEPTGWYSACTGAPRFCRESPRGGTPHEPIRPMFAGYGFAWYATCTSRSLSGLRASLKPGIGISSTSDN